jgi:LysM domain
MFKRLPAVLAAMMLTVGVSAFAAEMRADHPSTYVVRKGDTLWDISARFLNKPWLWPEIWQANPQVKNPHLIYPGDVLSLAYIDGRTQITSEPQARTGDPIDTIPLSDIQAFLKQLTVVNDIKSLPYVVGLEEDHLLTASGQVVYVRNLVGAQPGQEVQIARATNVFGNEGVSPLDFRGDRFHTHWVYADNVTRSEAHGPKKGYELMQQATGEVTNVQGEIATVLLRQEGRDVRVGDRILPMPPPYDSQFFPQAPTSIPEGAHVVAVADGTTMTGPRSVVALSIGSAQGVKNGVTFSMWRNGGLHPDSVANRRHLTSISGGLGGKVDLPDEFSGHVLVFRTFDQISYGLVMDGIRPSRVGDLLKNPDATQ